MNDGRTFRFETLTSTNDEARDPRYSHGDLIVAERQQSGRGQRGHAWLSPGGLNLTFSLVLEPRFLPAARQFSLLEAVALGLCDAAADCGIAARIKWTNDLYAGDRKAAGILIEHSLAEGGIARTIVGIGLNVNQTEFDPALPNPTSLRCETGRTFDREPLLQRCRTAILTRYAALERGEAAALHRAYLDRLWRRGLPCRFRLPEGEPFTGTLCGVRPTGELEVRYPDGTLHAHLFRTIELLPNAER